MPTGMPRLILIRPDSRWVTGLPDTDRFPSKFKAISDYANNEDVKTLLWFEPERISITTKQYNNTPETEYRVKPEWLIGYGEAGSQIAYGVEGNAFQLDLGNKEAFDWLCNRVSTIIKEGGISIYREDLNSNYIDETWAGGKCGSSGSYRYDRKRLRYGTLCILGCASCP